MLNASLGLIKVQVERLKKENEELRKENARLQEIVTKFALKQLDQ